MNNKTVINADSITFVLFATPWTTQYESVDTEGSATGSFAGPASYKALASLGETAYNNLCGGDGIKLIELSPAQLDIG